MAANVNMKADLKGASEVPPTDSKGTGSVTATFDTASKKLSWKGTVSGLSGPATAAHFHAGESGKNGGVAVPIAGADKGSFEGSATLTDAQAEELMAGKWYVNVHTAANKGGEVRGQVTK
ncbi:MAG: CHRD domain-containing protein [Pseudolabrys sp.]